MRYILVHSTTFIFLSYQTEGICFRVLFSAAVIFHDDFFHDIFHDEFGKSARYMCDFKSKIVSDEQLWSGAIASFSESDVTVPGR